MLTSAQTDIIMATVPILEKGGEALTTHFYKLLLKDHPEVRPLFNQTHQENGAQPRALANAVLIYARNIERLENLGPLAAQIVNKHVALQILPEHYPVVGKCLLQAIREVLGAETATDAVIAAWAAAYGQLADLLIGAEEARYAQTAAATGGWRGEREFKVVCKAKESSEITSFYLEPVDGKPVVAHEAGQYIGIRMEVDGQDIRRNYSLSAASTGRQYRISIKREPKGVASRYLHDQVATGSVVKLFPPSGAFTLIDSRKPLVLISGGVGITPTLAMAETALKAGDRRVIFIHYARDADVQAFKSVLSEWSKHYPRKFEAFVVHDYVIAGATPLPNAVGRPTIEQLEKWLPKDRNVDAYFLGPKPFMAFMKRALDQLGVPQGQTHYEFFGPAEALA